MARAKDCITDQAHHHGERQRSHLIGSHDTFLPSNIAHNAPGRAVLHNSASASRGVRSCRARNAVRAYEDATQLDSSQSKSVSLFQQEDKLPSQAHLYTVRLIGNFSGAEGKRVRERA
jgi:hypothetical protein